MTVEFPCRLAKPCRSCGQFYPGDCFRDGCKDEGCACDGCMVFHNEWLFIVEEDE